MTLLAAVTGLTVAAWVVWDRWKASLIASRYLPRDPHRLPLLNIPIICLDCSHPDGELIRGYQDQKGRCSTCGSHAIVPAIPILQAREQIARAGLKTQIARERRDSWSAQRRRQMGVK